METAIITNIKFHRIPAVKNNIWNNLLAVVDNQAAYKTAWYTLALVFQGVFFLPIPAVLMYYYHVSIIVLPITFCLYMGSIIVGMGGFNIRVALGYFLLSVIINLGMFAIYIL